MQSLTRSVALTGSGQVVMPRAAIYRGITVYNGDDSDPAVVRVYDNPAAAAGTVLDVIGLAAGESASYEYRTGLWATQGLYVAVDGGAVEGSLRIG